MNDSPNLSLILTAFVVTDIGAILFSHLMTLAVNTIVEIIPTVGFTGKVFALQKTFLPHRNAITITAEFNTGFVARQRLTVETHE